MLAFRVGGWNLGQWTRVQTRTRAKRECEAPTPCKPACSVLRGRQSVERCHVRSSATTGCGRIFLAWPAHLWVDFYSSVALVTTHLACESCIEHFHARDCSLLLLGFCRSFLTTWLPSTRLEWAQKSLTSVQVFGCQACKRHECETLGMCKCNQS